MQHPTAAEPVTVTAVLRTALAAIAARGYVRREETAKETPTADLVESVIRGELRPPPAPYAGRATADLPSLLAWCRDGATSANDFRRKIAALVALESVDPSHIGRLTAAAAAWQREERRRTLRQDRARSTHQGEQGQRLTVAVAVVAVEPISSNYGSRWRLAFRDDAGNVYAWKAQTDEIPTVGECVILTGTVAEHAVFRSVAETRLTRCTTTPDLQPED